MPLMATRTMVPKISTTLATRRFRSSSSRLVGLTSPHLTRMYSDRDLLPANTYSNVMYSMMDAEYFASCFFFIVCLLLTNFWLFNILVAVLLNTFSDVVGETKHSAFAAGSAYVIPPTSAVAD